MLIFIILEVKTKNLNISLFKNSNNPFYVSKIRDLYEKHFSKAKKNEFFAYFFQNCGFLLIYFSAQFIVICFLIQVYEGDLAVYRYT
jgi:hypothetical protein